MTLALTMGTRRWDHLLPITLGEVGIPGASITHRRGALTPTPQERAELDVAERSLSEMLLGAGDTAQWLALPAFPLAAFRQRCLIVRRDSPLHTLGDLAGTRIGATGWADTGNVWTKALLVEAGVDIGGIDWRVGPLEDGEPVRPRLTGLIGAAATPQVRELEPGRCLHRELLQGNLDAVMTPTMPDGYHEPGSPLRHLLPDFRRQEEKYFADKGFVPPIHVLAIRRTVAERLPWLPSAMVQACDRSFRAWRQERILLADTTPWLIEEATAIGRTLGFGYSPYGRAGAAPMIDALVGSYAGQGVGPLPRAAPTIFDDYDSFARTGSRPEEQQ